MTLDLRSEGGLRSHSSSKDGLAAAGLSFLRLCKRVRALVGERRYRHVLGVARAAERLARRHGVSTSKARLAGMLHDLARNWAPEEMLAFARRRGMRISAIEQASPVLLHARIGTELARTEFGVMDSDALGAMERHTVAAPGMSTLEKCVYLADSIEPTRQYPDRKQVEELAERSLDEALFMGVRSSLIFLLKRGAAIAPETIDLYNQLVQRYGQGA